jgi:pimeloyl-ACP methyl ester carboxylesterase
MPAWVMMALERRIARHGFRTARFGYSSARADLERNSVALARFIEALGCERVHLVGHSLGAVLSLYAIESCGLRTVRRVLALGPPFVDSYAARRLKGSGVGRWMLGPCIPQWLECKRPGIPEGVEVGVIAGTVAFGLGMFVVPDLPRPNDGIVAVTETVVAGMKSRVEVPVSHSWMLASRTVGALACNFLLGGSFESPRDRCAGAIA